MIWVFLGEVLLPSPLRFSTFVGSRIGQIESHSTEKAAPGQAEAARIQAEGQADAVRTVAPSQAFAECINRRQLAALETYTSCTNDPMKYSSSHCEFYRDQVLAQSCDPS